MERAAKQQDELALSQLTLRKGLGILGISLPLVLFLASAPIAGLDLRRSLGA